MRVRFAPSPTGYLHIGSARTFIFNWLYARRNGGTMILRIDDTDVERNTQASLDSIFEGLKWLDLGWDELYHASQRVELHRRLAEELLQRGFAYRDFTPAAAEAEESGSHTNSICVAWYSGFTLMYRAWDPSRRHRLVCGSACCAGTGAGDTAGHQPAS